jgi:PAS domain-containing protein
MSTSLPDHESERLQALRRYSILDTPPEGSFDQITAVAAELFRVPIDRKARDLSDAERAMLMKLAAIVIDQMELRLSVRRMADVEESERQMAERLRESEERFRDLFDEAPIAYVHEGLDSRFIRVNRTAMRILGINPEEVAGSYGVSFVPDTPEAQARVRQGRTRAAWYSSSAARTAASRCGSSGGPGRTRAAPTRGRCSSTSPNGS